MLAGSQPIRANLLGRSLLRGAWSDGGAAPGTIVQARARTNIFDTKLPDKPYNNEDYIPMALADAQYI
jgi:hypothetical protein